MGVLSDRQIRRDVKMTNFEEYDREKQLGRVSHGLGSYGYDVRIGYRFKVFKPYPCTVIDPKAFNPAMLEDVDLTPYNKHAWVQTKLKINQCAYCGTMTETVTEELLRHHCPDSEEAGEVPDHILIPPHSFILGESVEEFFMPRDCLCVVVGKSTYARCGLIVNVTPGEPEWDGKWTIEVSNTTPLPAKVYCGEGIMQAMFFRSDERLEAAVEMIRKMGQETNMTWVHTQVGNILRASCETSYKDKKGKFQNQTGITLPKVTSKDESMTKND